MHVDRPDRALGAVEAAPRCPGREAEGGGELQPPVRDRAPRPDLFRWLANYGDLMWRYAIVRLRDPVAAEEVIQKVLRAAPDANSPSRTDGSEKIWVMAILERQIADFLRERSTGKRPRPSDAASIFDDEGRWRVRPRRWPADPEQVMASPDFWYDLTECLRDLPPRVSNVLVLYELRRVRPHAVCAALRISNKDLRARLREARLILRRCMSLKCAPDWEGGC